jgi:hypothetical protein
MWSWFAGTEAEAIQAEYEYGRECARQFAAQFSGKAPREKQEVVAAVGSRLADAVKDRRREFHFSLVRANVSNAYALPGGFVFITEPLLDLCAQDPDELAFLLGHEMGHASRPPRVSIPAPRRALCAGWRGYRAAMPDWRSTFRPTPRWRSEFRSWSGVAKLTAC